MKYLFFTFLLFLMVNYAYTQGEIISNNIYQYSGRLGIGNSTAEYLLDIKSDAGYYGEHPRQFIQLHNINNSNTSSVSMNFLSGTENNIAGGSIGVCAYSYEGNPKLKGFTYLYSQYSGLALRAVGERGVIKFNTQGNGDEFERMRIDSVGNIGIGTTNPKAKLQVTNGDIFISDISKGIIMKSPDGNCWRGVLDNTGNLTFSTIDCPDEEYLGIINSSSDESEIVIYPNPAQNEIMIELAKRNGVAEYKIYTVSGHLVDNGFISSNLNKINISSLPSGNYIMNVYSVDGHQFANKKIVKE
ncbi:MAG: hypothetical protein C0599_09820 [Salinivirgaceae bacterium]|nr:MAG: hypothetical protein C0599_09820 [Salinivirgaceae bacterium]